LHTGHPTKTKTGHLANTQIPRLGDVSGGISLYTGSSLKHREVKMELTLRRYGITVKVLRERSEEKTPHIVRRLYRRNYSEQHRDLPKELLEASSPRYLSPIR
jgi:hypothetical protein